MEQTPRVRIEWVGCAEIPEVLRECAATEIQCLAQACAQMRAMTVERRRRDREDLCSLTCRCKLHQRSLCIRRASLGEALQAFDRMLRTRCAR